MRRGVRLAVDVGDVRIGVARSDPGGILASPVEVVPRANTGSTDLARIAELAAADEAIEVIVGLPLGLSGREGPAAQKARAFASELAGLLRPGVPVRLFDERLSTVSAHQAYRSQGQSTRRIRGRIDAAAAAVILQSALDAERTADQPPGEIIGNVTGTDRNGPT